MELRIVTRPIAASIFAPCLFSLSFDVCSFVGEALSPPHQQQAAALQSQPNIFAVTVIVVDPGRSLCFLFPSHLLACKRSF